MVHCPYSVFNHNVVFLWAGRKAKFWEGHMPHFHPVPHIPLSASAEVIKYIVSLTVDDANQISEPLQDVLLLQNVHSIAVTILGFGFMCHHFWKMELS